MTKKSRQRFKYLENEQRSVFNEICQTFFFKLNTFLITNIVELFFNFQQIVRSILDNYTPAFISLLNDNGALNLS